ncbi:uncharacterized protein LOC144943104 isoform X1 [Lampetra fluviatilis]
MLLVRTFHIEYGTLLNTIALSYTNLLRIAVENIIRIPFSPYKQIFCLPSADGLLASHANMNNFGLFHDESERSQPSVACSWKDSVVVASPPTPSDNGGVLGFDDDGRATAGRADDDAQAEATVRAKMERFYRSVAENGREEVQECRRQQDDPQAPQRPQRQRRTPRQLGEQLPWPAMEEGPYPIHACPWAETAPAEAARVRSALLGAAAALASTGDRPYALRSVAMASLVLRAHGCGAFTTPGSRDRAVPGLAGPVVDWVLGVLASRGSGDGE